MCGGGSTPITNRSFMDTADSHCTEKQIPDPLGAHHIVWQAPLPTDVSASLISCDKTTGKVTNSELELVVGMTHNVCMLVCNNIWERTTLTRTDNTEFAWWNQKGSSMSTSPPARLLRLQAIHQRFRRYVPCQFFRAGWKMSFLIDYPNTKTLKKLLLFIKWN